ncbi:hypothetical protein ACKT27_004962, partial [Salmonella enterica subsp. enterica serovar Newport]
MKQLPEILSFFLVRAALLQCMDCHAAPPATRSHKRLDLIAFTTDSLSFMQHIGVAPSVH